MSVRASRVFVGGESFEILEGLGAARREYWAQLWPSALALIRWLSRCETLPSQVVELGCGIGLVSTYLGKRGVSVLATDAAPEALALAQRNVNRNHVDRVVFRPLEWGEEAAGWATATQDLHGRFKVFGRGVSLIVGSDLLYEEDAVERLGGVLTRSPMLAPGGRLVLAGPEERDGLLQELVAELQRLGFTHMARSEWVRWRGRSESVGVHELTKPA